MLGNLVISYWDNDNDSIISDFKNLPNVALVKNDSSLVKNTAKELVLVVAPLGYIKIILATMASKHQLDIYVLKFAAMRSTLISNPYINTY